MPTSWKRSRSSLFCATLHPNLGSRPPRTECWVNTTFSSPPHCVLYCGSTFILCSMWVWHRAAIGGVILCAPAASSLPPSPSCSRAHRGAPLLKTAQHPLRSSAAAPGPVHRGMTTEEPVAWKDQRTTCDIVRNANCKASRRQAARVEVTFDR